MSQYFGMVKCIDDNVGRILDHLRENKLLDNTIIVFTADHGDLCGEHGRHNKGVPLEASDDEEDRQRAVQSLRSAPA